MYVNIKGQMTSLQTEKKDLRNDLPKEIVEILRLRKETETGTLERQVKEWAARANKTEETRNARSKAIEEAVKRAREGEKKARAEKNGFVKELQKIVEIGSIDALHREGIRGYVLAQDRVTYAARGLGEGGTESMGGSWKRKDRITTSSWRVEADEENT